MKKLYPVIHVNNLVQTRRNLDICQEIDVDGVFLINHRINWKKLKEIFERVNIEYNLLIGINALDLSPVDCHRNFLDTLVWFDDIGITSDGIFNRLILKNISESRRNNAIFGSINFKYQNQIKEENLETELELAKNVPFNTFVTSGDGTGIAADLEKIKKLNSIVSKFRPWIRLGLASGVSIENVKNYLPYVDDFLVATSITDNNDILIKEKVVELNRIIHAN